MTTKQAYQEKTKAQLQEWQVDLDKLKAKSVFLKFDNVGGADLTILTLTQVMSFRRGTRRNLSDCHWHKVDVERFLAKSARNDMILRSVPCQMTTPYVTKFLKEIREKQQDYEPNRLTTVAAISPN